MLFFLPSLGTKLGSKFAELRSLKKLDFSEGKKCAEIPRGMFKALTNIQLAELDMSNLDIQQIQPEVLSALSPLKTLRMANNPAFKDNQTMFHIIKAMKKNAIKHLYLNNTGIERSLSYIIRELNGTDLRTLVVDNNRIPDYEPILSKCLPNIEILSFADNIFYIRTENALDFENLRHIRGCNTSWQHRTGQPGGNPYPYRTKRASTICGPNMACPVRFPKSLEWMDMAHFGIHLPEIPEVTLITNSSLSYWSLAYSGIQSIKQPMYCAFKDTSLEIVPKLVSFDVSGNAIGCVNATFFNYCNWSSLNVLNACANKLRQIEQSDCNFGPTYFLDFLKPLWNLTKLDLSENIIETSLIATSFPEQHQMQELYLSEMGLYEWSVNISHMEHLRLLDISGNKIQFLKKGAISDLEHIKYMQIKKYNKSLLQLDVSNNNLQCNCEALEFLDFLRMTKTMFLNADSYLCTKLNGEQIELRYMEEIFNELLVDCTPMIWFYTTVALQTTLFLIIAFASIVKRFKFHLLFAYMGLRVWFSGKRQTRNYPYDAFISNCESEKEWVKRLVKNLEKRNVKLVTAMNFIAGRDIVENINNALKMSRKVVFVISNNFLKSPWCLKEFSMALNVSITMKPSASISLFAFCLYTNHNLSSNIFHNIISKLIVLYSNVIIS